MCRSAHEQDRLEALLHLEQLAMAQRSSSYMRDSLYLMAVLRYVMEDYDAARGCAEELCRLDPDNPQVRNLFIAIRYKHEQAQAAAAAKKEEREQVGWAVGLGVGLAALGVGLALALTKPKK